MFTGIIQDIGTVTAIDKKGDWILTIASQKLPLEKMAIGGSVACNGTCLTIIEKQSSQFKAQVSQETLGKTTVGHWQSGTKVNLEPALRVGDELGGHLLTGHIDGIARIVGKTIAGESILFQFEVPPEFAAFIAPKGSIALNGVSLTVNEVDKARFTVNIIPHTQSETTFIALKTSDEVNFEVDLIARYIHRMRNAP